MFLEVKGKRFSGARIIEYVFHEPGPLDNILYFHGPVSIALDIQGVI